MNRCCARTLSAVMALLLSSSCLAHAEGAGNLASTVRSMTAMVPAGQSVVIRESSTSRVIRGGTPITPAENIAINQILSSGRQTIRIGSLGDAIGGQLVLNSAIFGSDLVVPSGVTAIGNMSGSGSLQIFGNLINSGTIYAFASSKHAEATLSAANIVNQLGGIISSYAPLSIAAASANRNLALQAVHDLVNHGTITSAGSLALTAGGSVLNTATADKTKPAPLIESQLDLSIASTTGEISNEGIISSVAGNIGMVGKADTMTVNNTGGKFLATAGSILASLCSDSTESNLSIVGGDFIAKFVNLSAPQGSVTMDVQRLDGILNSVARIAHVYTSTPNLTLGSTCISGDPVYYNTGNITIAGDVLVNERLAIVAGGNITSTAAVNEIRARDAGGQGYDIHIVAGANVSPACGSCSGNAASGTESTTAITINPNSPSGGDIDFSASPNLKILSSSTSGNLAGGSVTLAAFSNGATGGRILLAPGSVVNASGNGSGLNGNITLIAGDTGGTSIKTGQLIASGGGGTSPTSGIITIQTSQPTTAGALPISFNTTGSITTGNALIGSGTLMPTDVELYDKVSAKTAINISAGGNVQTKGYSSSVIPVGTTPNGVTLSSDNTRLYVANRNSGTVSVIDTATNSVVSTILVGGNPVNLGFTPDGVFGFVSNDNNTVSVFNTSTESVVKTIPVGTGPVFIAASPNRHELYATCGGSNNVYVIDTLSMSVVGTINVGDNPDGTAVSPDGSKLLIANFASNNVSVIDVATRTVVATIDLGAGASPTEVAFHPSGDFAYVNEWGPNSLAVIDTSSNTVTTTLPVGVRPSGVTFNAAGTLAYISYFMDNVLTVVDTSTHTIAEHVPLPGTGSTANGRLMGVVNGVPTAFVPRLDNNSLNVVRFGVLTAPNLDIQSNGSLVRANTNARVLQVSGAPLTNVLITEDGSTSVDSVSTAARFNLTSLGDLIVDGTIAATNVRLQTALSSNIFIGGDLNVANSTILQTFNNGNVQFLTSAPTISSNTLAVKSQSGSFGTSILPLEVAVAAVSAQTNGSAYLDATGDIALSSSKLAGNLQVASTGSLTVSGPVVAGTIDLSTTAGSLADMIITAPTSSDSDVLLSVQGSNSITGAALITANRLIIVAGTGTANLNTSVNFLDVSASGNVTVTESNGISVGAVSGTPVSLAINATTGNIGTTAPTSAANLSLNALAGSITLGSSVTGSTSTSLTVSGINTIASSSNTVAGGTLNISAGTGSVSLTTDIDEVMISSSAPITLTEADDLQLGTTTAQSLSIAAIGGSITTTGNSTVSGSIALETSMFANSHTLSSQEIHVNSGNAQALTVSGNGSGTWTASDLIVLTSSTGDLTFGASQTFLGTTILNSRNIGQRLVIASGTTVASNAPIYVNTPTVVIQGTGNISADSLTISNQNGAGLIVNPSGDIKLTSNLTFNGKDLAILAFGNITATSSVTKINLSSNATSGGSLTLVAGFEVSPSGGGQVGPEPTIYTLGNPSSSGGSILLPKVSVNTSATAVDAHAGRVTVIASSSQTNSGSIHLGSITANANTKTGLGGYVQIIGPGGVQVGQIRTDGATGGRIDIFGASANIIGGPIVFSNGVMTGDGVFRESAPTPGAGAAILVAGSLNSSGANGRGGDISLSADGQIQVTKNILAVGMRSSNPLLGTAGGTVWLQSALSSVSIGTGGISTSGLNIANSSSNEVAGAGGNITIEAANAITILGNVIAKGGDTVGSGGGGDAGNVSLTTSNPTTNGFYIGNIKVSGYVDLRGGNASALGGNSGGGGDFSSESGSMQILGMLGGISVNTSNGSGPVSSSGLVTIDTYAIQPLTPNLSLLSKNLSEVALPGGLFTLGTANPVNGAAGSIVSGSITAKKSLVGSGTGRIFDTNPFLSARINISVTGPNLTINNSSGSKNIAIFDSTKNARIKVTPSESLALFQKSRGDAQTVFLSASGQTRTGSALNVADLDLPQLFLSFKLQAVDSPTTGVQLNISGVRPVLTLPSVAVVGANINFTSAGSIPLVDFGSGKMNILPGGSLAGTNTTKLILSGTAGTWTNSGIIEAADIIIARPTTAPLGFTIKGSGAELRGTAGSTNPKILLGPAVDLAMRVNFIALNSTFAVPVEFGVIAIPTVYRTLATTNAASATQLKPVAISFALTDPSDVAIPAIIQGTVTASSILISGITGKTAAATSTPLTIGDASMLAADSSIKLTAAGNLFIGDTVSLTSGLVATGASPTGVLSPSDVLKTGSITISAGGTGGIVLGSGNSMVSTGADLVVTASLGNLSIGSANEFEARGGRIIMLANGTVTGAQGNTFYARSTDAMANTGGGIEVGSGLIVSTALTQAFALPKNSNPTTGTLGSGVTINNSNGVVVGKKTGGGIIDLNAGPGPTSVLTLNHGAIVFDSIGSGSSIIFDDSSFVTDAVKPIGDRQKQHNDLLEILVDVDDDFETEN